LICEYCKQDHDGSYGSGRFCSNKCARGFSTKNKRLIINEKLSKKYKGYKFIKGGVIKLCDYGCGKEAKYQFKNGKWCCSNSANQCSENRKKNSKGLRKARLQGKGRNLTSSDGNKGRESYRRNLQEKYKTLSFEDKPYAERRRIIEHEQNYKCKICGISNWMNKPLTLHLDHIDGNRKNDNRDNLRLICPNCHSQTNTYCRRNSIIIVTDDELRETLTKNNNNISKSLNDLNLVPGGTNWKRAKQLIVPP